MIVGISTMQVHEDSRPSHNNPASETSLETDPSAVSYPNEESHPPPYQMHQHQHQHHHYQGALMPPQQVYVDQNGGHMPDVGMLAHQFQALGMQHHQQQQYHHHPQQQRGGQDAPQSGDSETGDENDGTTETEEDPVKLFVGQVPKKMSEEDIFPTFDAFGPLKDVAIIRDKITGLHRGCAFVTFWNSADAERAQEALHDKFTFPGGRKPAQVKPAEPSGTSILTNPVETKLFVGMLSRKAGEEEVRELFEPFGEIREIHMIRSPDGNSKCAAFLRFVQHESAVQAIEELNNVFKMEGSARPLIVKFADNKQQKQQRHMRNMRKHEMMLGMGPPSGYAPYPPQGPHMGMPPVHHPGAGPQYPMPPPPHFAPPGPYGPAAGPHHPYVFPHQFTAGPPPPYAYDQGPPPPIQVQSGAPHGRPREGPAGANLFVYHLPHDLTDADLATAFNPFGNVISAKVYVDKYTGESKGFGFVSYDSVISAEQAIEQMNGFQIGTKRLKVQHKRVHGMNPNLPPHDPQRQQVPYPDPEEG